MKPDKDLIRGVLMNLQGHTPNSEQYRFGVVTDVFGIGSTMAKDLCVEYGLDPYQMVKGVVCENCLEAEEVVRDENGDCESCGCRYCIC